MISINNLQKSYKNNLILYIDNFIFKKNKSYLIVGSNGSGKSTMIKCLLGINKLTKGKVTINTKNIAYVPEKYFFPEFCSIEKFLKSILSLYELEQNEYMIDYYCELFNGSSISTLNSIAKNVVGFRSHLNFYDEAGKVERDFFDLTEPFCTQDRDFITGANFNIKCMPKQMPNQMIYASSAEGVDSRLYDIYKESALRMIGGDMSYFCCDITCELSLHPYLDGKPYRPLLSQDVIDNALKMNEFRANREYFNKFDLWIYNNNFLNCHML